jgi:hypothetical protein
VKSPANGLVMPNCKDAAPKRTITADDVLRSQMILPIRERLIFRLAVCEGMRPGDPAVSFRRLLRRPLALHQRAAPVDPPGPKENWLGPRDISGPQAHLGDEI